VIRISGHAVPADDRTKSRTAPLGFAELSVEFYTSSFAWVHVPGRPFLGCLCDRDLPKDGVPRDAHGSKHYNRRCYSILRLLRAETLSSSVVVDSTGDNYWVQKSTR
jgi:hypothetical protein